jgi:hypothetical protein
MGVARWAPAYLKKPMFRGKIWGFWDFFVESLPPDAGCT